MALRRRTADGSRWEKDNRLSPNVGAFAALALALVALAGLFLLFGFL